MWTREQVDELVVGDAIRRLYNEGNRNNKLMHVRAKVDDGVVVRYWLKSRQSWHYEVLFWYALSEADCREAK